MRRLSRSGTCSCFGPCTSGSREATTPSTSTSDAEAAHRGLMADEVHERAAEERARRSPPIGRPGVDTAAVLRRAARAATLPIAQASAADQETALKTPAAKRRPTSSANDPTNACSGAAIANSSVAAIVTRRGPKRSARFPAGTDAISTAAL